MKLKLETTVWADRDDRRACLYSYYVRELLAALTLFSMAFFFLALVGLGALLIWCASVQVAIWATPASRNMIAFSRRLIAAYAKP